MTTRINRLSVYSLLFILLFGLAFRVSAQEKASVSAGIGIPELLNVGLRYRFDRTQAGLSIGSMPVHSNEGILSVCGNFKYNVGDPSPLTQVRPWYGKIGINYLRDKNDYKIDEYFYLNPRIGREFNLSRKMGMELDLGAIIMLNHAETIRQTSNGWDIAVEFPVLPSIGISLFYRL